MAEKREANIVLKDLRNGAVFKKFKPTEGGYLVFEDEEIDVSLLGKGDWIQSLKTRNEFIPEGSYELVVTKNLSALSVSLDVECSEALKGLKAVTRAAKEATAALKELGEQQNNLATTNEIKLNINGEAIAKVIAPHYG